MSLSDELAYLTNLKEKQAEIFQAEIVALKRRIAGMTRRKIDDKRSDGSLRPGG
jgi:hypothetical protein